MIHVVDQVECLYRAKTLCPPMVENEMISQFMDKKTTYYMETSCNEPSNKRSCCRFRERACDTFGNDQHPDTKFDYIIANPPFNISDWGGEKYEDDPRWVYGRPPAGNANYAWLQHMLWKLAPGGQAGVVLANGSMSSNTGGEGEIRKAMIEGDVVEIMIALPGQLFLNTQIQFVYGF